MFEAQLLVASGEGTLVFSPWFPRQGDNATFTLEVVATNGVELDVQVFTKNVEDPGDGTPVLGGAIALSAPGISRGAWGPDTLLELVRYQFVARGEGLWVLFRMLPPVWCDSVAG